MSIFAFFLVVIIIVAASVAINMYGKMRREQAYDRWLASRRTTLLRIQVPKNNEKTPSAAESLFAALHGIYRPDSPFQEFISFEIAATSKAIEFYVQCPAELRDFVEGQIYAQYPNSQMDEISDYSRLVDLNEYKVAGAELTLNRSDVYPIKTFQNFEVDPLAGITGVLSKVSEEEQIWIQIVSQPVSDSWQERAMKTISATRGGKSSASSNIFIAIGKGLLEFIRPGSTSSTPGEPPKLSASQEQALKAVEEKATKLGYATKIRVLVLAGDTNSAVSRVNAVGGVFKQFNTINTNGFAVGKVLTDPSFVDTYRSRMFTSGGLIMNIEELASVFHFPNATVETPNILWAGSKKGEPPTSLPIVGSVEVDKLTMLGITDFRGHQEKFGIKVPDRRQHMYAIGKSGTGKSTLLENMAIDDIRKGRGLAIVDPHGDFVNHILDFIPDSRIDDVIYFNPSDREYAVGFNLLENVDPAYKNIVASGVVGIFKKLFAESWGPRLEYILRNVVLALLEYPDATILDIMKFLVDKGFRDKVLEKVSDPIIRDFIINEYNKWDPKFRMESIQSIQNKVGQFLSATTIRNIVGQAHSTFDIEQAMDSGKILLFDFSVGKIGEDAATLLGAMMITKIQLAAMRRANIPNPEDRKDFYLYVDEFQTFATDSFATILSEARKYRLNMVLTHQYIGQLPEKVTGAIFGNVGTLIAFRVGSGDAAALVKEFEPVFDENDMVNLGNHNIYVKMSIDGVTRPAFSAGTFPPATDSNENRERVIHKSREQYSRPREEVEKSILEQSQQTVKAVREAVDEVAAQDEIVIDGLSYTAKTDKEGNQWYVPRSSSAEGDSVSEEKEEKNDSSNKDEKEASVADDKPVIKTEPIIKDTSVLETKNLTENEPVKNKDADLQAIKPDKPELKNENDIESKPVKPERDTDKEEDNKQSSTQSKGNDSGDDVQQLQPDEMIIFRD